MFLSFFVSFSVEKENMTPFEVLATGLIGHIFRKYRPSPPPPQKKIQVLSTGLKGTASKTVKASLFMLSAPRSMPAHVVYITRTGDEGIREGSGRQPNCLVGMAC